MAKYHERTGTSGALSCGGIIEVVISGAKEVQHELFCGQRSLAASPEQKRVILGHTVGRWHGALVVRNHLEECQIPLTLIRIRNRLQPVSNPKK